MDKFRLHRDDLVDMVRGMDEWVELEDAINGLKCGYLNKAARTGNVRGIQRSLELGADVNGVNVTGCEDYDGCSALFVASRYAGSDISLNAMKMLLKAKADVNQKHGGDEETALMAAACYSSEGSSLDAVKLLIQSGADLDCKDRNGATALMYSATNSHDTSSLDTVKYLVEAGCDINIQDSDGETALYWACYGSRSDISPETVQYLIDIGADLDLRNNNRYSVLDRACYFYTVPEIIIQSLIKAGAAITKAHDRVKKYPLIHLRGLHEKLVHETQCFANRTETAEMTKKASLVDVEPVRERTFNLLNIPHCQLPDAIQLYLYGCFPSTHPLSEQVAKVKGVYDDGIANVEKDEIDEVVEEIKGVLKEIGVILYMRTRTPEGREKLKKMAINEGAVDDEDDDNNNNNNDDRGEKRGIITSKSMGLSSTSKKKSKKSK